MDRSEGARPPLALSGRAWSRDGGTDSRRERRIGNHSFARRFVLFAVVLAIAFLFSSEAATNGATGQGFPIMVKNLPYYGQKFTEDCETAALQMALAHEGIHVSQEKLLEAEHIDTRGPLLDSAGNLLMWGDPYTSFVGHPNSADISVQFAAAQGYGTYAPNIARVARQFGATVLWSGTGLTRQRLERFIEQGHPVIAWVGDSNGHMRYAPLAYWTAYDGRLVPYPAPWSGVYEHAVVVGGITKRGPFIDNPLNGARNGPNINPVVGPGVVSWHSFLAGFATFDGMAVVLR